eukprot:TRINITY_DN7184_c1_g1_i1.p1 TRINITY_DN7184_c1_g1~~TRINITY_DN7184_c1_g1_i1.p1  ORF type:complete len:359 (-),score=59.76 TRINITY_DN7184_c1_g1_i1:6-983(-)
MSKAKTRRRSNHDDDEDEEDEEVDDNVGESVARDSACCSGSNDCVLCSLSLSPADPSPHKVDANMFCRAPPYTEKPQLQDSPFITTLNGTLPEYPRDLDSFLYAYAKGRPSRMPNIDVNHECQEIKSLSSAKKILQDAHGSHLPFWGAFSCEDAIRHPSWWPRDRPAVPGYTQIIVGSGPTDIGLHIDKYSPTKGQPEAPVSTYITICAGSKQVLMLPPGSAENIFPPGTRTVGNFPSNLSAGDALAQKIQEVGGFYFKLQPRHITSSTQQMVAPSHNNEDKDDDDDLDQRIIAEHALTLFVPKGWSHWLLGGSTWAAIFGGTLM